MRFLNNLFRLFRKLVLFFFPKKQEPRSVSFTSWLELLRTAALEGYDSEAYHLLCRGFPESGKEYYRTDGGRLLVREMEKYANTRLTIILNDFQEKVTSALRENDEMYMETAFRGLESDLSQCMFFERLEGFPEDLSESLSSQMTAIIVKWQADYGKVLRDQFETFSTGSLGEELLWLFTIHPPVDMLERENRL